MLIDFIESSEKVLDVTVIKNMLLMQAADVHQTFANTTSLEHDYIFKSKIDIHNGFQTFAWLYNFF